MFRIVLFQPEIPPNTGNIIRLAANTGSTLHLVKPLGFEMSDTKLRRAGLDYRDLVNVNVHDSLDDVLVLQDPSRIFAFSTKGSRNYCDVEFRPGDVLLFGPETRGLPSDIRERFAETLLRIPMRADSRSLNLGNAVAIALYEAWRQQKFKSGT